MYQGYRIKINGIKVNNTMIARGTYSISTTGRVIDSWEDADKIKHEVLAKKRKTTISFELREHKSSEHAEFIRMVEKTENVPVEFYDDKTDSYTSGTFKMDTVEFSHKNATKTEITYNTTKVALEEY